MDSKAEVYLKRARSEIDSAAILFETSGKKELKDLFNLDETTSFYSGVIAHAYYSIFYCAKALLLSKNIVTEAPEVHKKTLEAFDKTFIISGLLDAKLLLIYQKMIIRAETLLEIFKWEKGKRGNFTYNTIPQANKQPAEESLENAKAFFKHSQTYLINS